MGRCGLLWVVPGFSNYRVKMPNKHKVLVPLLNFPSPLLQSSMEHTSTGIGFGANSLRLLTKLEWS